MNLSIIIVNYYLHKELFECIKIIFDQPTKIKFEVVLVDNGSAKGFQEKLQKKFPKIKYLKAPKNLGYGAGNNLGAGLARGKYLFFLNPDTKLYSGSLDSLVAFLQENEHCGVVAPNLVHQDDSYFSQQGSLTLTPLRSIAVHSIFNKLWPKNPMAQKFWLAKVDKKEDRQIEVVPGTALMISKELFNRVGKFDEKYFMYFEEHDLCKRVIENGKEIWMLGQTKVFHEWGATTKNLNLKPTYAQSFKYYLTKHYGWCGWLAFLIGES